MEKSFTKRLQELAGITEESKMKSRIDQALEKTDIVYDGGIETGTEDYMEFIGEIYQVPFEYDDDELEEEENYPHSKFLKLIDKKKEELNFSWYDIEDYLETKGIEFV
tara:strand:+ start:326 stop:649 length:324 start_codon:yes stop_codon:yes gene_type:complete